MIVGYNDYIILTFRYTDNSLNIVTDIDAKVYIFITLACS